MSGDPSPQAEVAGSSPAVGEAVMAQVGIVEYSDAAYLAAYPDVEIAVGTGEFPAALDHYHQVGKPNGFLAQAEYLRQLAGGVQEQPGHGALSLNIDVMLASASGVVFVVGWSDDLGNKLLSLSIVQGQDGWNTRAIARCRRTDVEDLLQAPLGHAYGFWLLHRLPSFKVSPGPLMLRARFADGRFCQIELTPAIVGEYELRETVLGHFAALQYLGNRDIESYQQLDGGVGAALVALNRSVCAGITAAAHVERFGPSKPRFAASFIVCLFGKSEYFFLQNALFSPGDGVAGVEFIYVSNSPELAEILHKDARIAGMIYGLSITLVTLPGNAGFSAANNVAVSFARSARVVFINPDVFPRDDHWAAEHGAIVANRPPAQTRLFGAPLFYDDGSLMHGGMYFEVDRGLSVNRAAVQASSVIRVEHYGKGAPAWSDRYTRPRPVPAVTGAFISADRGWFESLGGFAEEYVFGHYEDADLCLKSLERGTPAWLQDVRFWHLEGKGSVRRPAHEGGSLVNRWAFTRKWGPLINASLAGRAPTHPLLQTTGASAPGQAKGRRGDRARG